MMARLVAEAAKASRHLALQLRVALGRLVRDAVAEIDDAVEAAAIDAVDEAVEQPERRRAAFCKRVAAMMDIGNDSDARNHENLRIDAALVNAASVSTARPRCQPARLGSMPC